MPHPDTQPYQFSQNCDPLLRKTLPPTRPRAKRANAQLYCFRALIALSPLPLGSARPLAWDVLGLLVAVLVLFSVDRPFRNQAAIVSRLFSPFLLYILILLWIVIQTASWVPASWHSAVWDEASASLGQPIAAAIAVDRQAPFEYLVRLLSYAGVFFLSLIFSQTSGDARGALKLIAISGSIYAGYGLFVFWSGNKYLLFMPKWAYLGDLTSVFVNRNSFATYLGLCTLVIFACLLDSLIKDLRLFGDWRTKLLSLVEFFSARVWLVVCIFVSMTALLLTHSRGGFVSFLAGVTVFALTLAIAPSLRKLGRIRWLAPAFIIAVLAVFVSGGPTVNRLIGTDVDAEERVAVYRLVLQAIGDHPLLGNGLGSFPSVFPMYRTSDVINFYDLAHNDYLENALELGIPAAVGLFGVVAWLAATCFSGVRTRRRGAVFPCLGVAATALVAIHSMVDFSLQIPAVTATYLFVLGVAVMQSFSSRDDAN